MLHKQPEKKINQPEANKFTALLFSMPKKSVNFWKKKNKKNKKWKMEKWKKNETVKN